MYLLLILSRRWIVLNKILLLKRSYIFLKLQVYEHFMFYSLLKSLMQLSRSVVLTGLLELVFHLNKNIMIKEIIKSLYLLTIYK